MNLSALTGMVQLDYQPMRRTISSLFLLSLLVLPACTESERHDSEPDAIVVVTTATYDQLIKQTTRPIVLDFWASWCGPCRTMAPIFAQASLERPDMVFGKVNVDEEPKLAQKHDVRAIPTLLVIVDGKVVKRSVGVLNKEALLKLLDEVIKKKPDLAVGRAPLAVCCLGIA